MKQMPGRKNHKLYTDKYLSDHESLLQRRLYEKEKQEYQNSEECAFVNSVRDAVKEMTEVEQEAYKKMYEAMAVLKDKSLDLIKQYLKKYNDKVSTLPLDKLEEALSEVGIAIKKLQQMCQMEAYQKQLRYTYYSEYERLFIALVDKVDVRFALYAPERVIARTSNKYYKLPDEYKDSLFERFEEFGLTENKEFMDRYSIEFKEQIKGKDINV